MKPQHGAALLVILMIVGVMGAMFAMQAFTGATAQRDKLSATTLALAQARDALIGFALANGRLPRPAVSGANGIEMASCATETACTGLIPWATLGVTKLDAWGKVIRYSVTPTFANAAFALSTVMTKKIQTRNGAGALTYQRGTTTACVTTLATATDALVDCVPAVLFSHGKSNFGTTDSGVSIANLSATNIDETSNNTGTVAPAPAGTTFIQRSTSENTTIAFGGEFDDVVIWLSPVVLKTQMQKAGIL